MIPSNFRIEILPIRALLCAVGSKGLKETCLIFVTYILSNDANSNYPLGNPSSLATSWD